ncbi:hypothetical protein [Mucilaginibacter sp. FT3.2]|uniref:hypothetical protein n=1 Tax=Mucilaginibacter sp. FT3.2 TaxID=2723090 RepID=UPI00160AE01D|nr:hypothetical protein [Mucilaginibacter sp. FT3.2]MBB6234712.1 hypothetical protein [Mucilaginibacter sp. FT3.2]
MAQIKSISIPTPCQQLWQQMVPVEQGRHCESCSKTVTDFTVMTDKEIISYLGRQNNVCGRFDDFQLIRINQQLQNNGQAFTLFKKIGLVAAVMIAIPFAKANAQKKHKTEQTPVLNTHRDTLNIIPKQLTAADIKNNSTAPMIKDQDLKLVNVTQCLTGTIGGVTVSAVSHPAIVRIWTSVYDMLREY